ncbi:MAG: glycosyltransferase family 2 protein [Bacteroides sp.]|nr:glycosyltransferase family 2 protein [Bacteroides sp.]
MKETHSIITQINYIKKRCRDIKPLVVIRCITYNHEKYIRDALEGFVMQKADFHYVAIVHDDASTDSTPAIIQEYADRYPDIIFPIFELENQYSKHNGSLRKIMNEACDTTEAKYIAICEGDDYWTDPLKLQKQVNFLETHPDYSACLTKFISYNEVIQKKYALIGEDYSSLRDMLWKDLQFGTATLVLIRSLYNKYYTETSPENKNWLMGDKPLVLYMAAHGKVKTLGDCTAVYRILETSASHSLDINLQLKRARNTIDIYHYFANKYLENNKILNDKIEGGYIYRAYLIYRKNNLPIPKDLKEKIYIYTGKYYKVHIVNILLHFPFLQGIVYYLANLKNRIQSMKVKIK